MLPLEEDGGCALRNFQSAVLTGHAHSTLNETRFEKQ